MNEIIKWVLKFALYATFWVFLLSINFQGRTLFSYANETLVQNSVVQAVDEELADLWSRLKETARVTFSDDNREDEPTAI